MSRSTTKLFTLVALFATTLATGCGSDNTTPTTPTDPPVAINEAFTGTLTVNGAATFPFTVQQTGQVTAVLNSVTTTDAVIGLSLGTVTSQGTCNIIIANDSAVQGTVVTGNAANTGVFCARIYDVGKLTGPLDYQITVTHF